MRVVRGKKFQPVFTAAGIAVFIVSAVILIRSLSARNAYEILLSSAVLMLWIVLCFIGSWAGGRLADFEPVWKPSLPLTASSLEPWQVLVPAIKIPRFFRFHFVVKGYFFPQGSQDKRPVFAETSLPRKGEMTANMNISFPIGGVFQGEGSCRLRDIFGFFSFPCGHKQRRTLNVLCSSCEPKLMRIDAQSGAEDRRAKTSSDEERYYMREYAPGDRFRDINWKSSERIDTLITRISPDNQEKVTRIEVYFRNYGPDRPGIGDLWLLDRAKARLAWFLRSVREEKDSYIFNIRSAAHTWELKEQEEMDSFLDELAAIPFAMAHNEDISLLQTGGAGEIYIFSTACDTALPGFLVGLQSRPVTLFMAQNTAEGVKAEYNLLRIRNFFVGGVFPRLRWLVKQRKRQLSIPGARAIIDYAEARL